MHEVAVQPKRDGAACQGEADLVADASQGHESVPVDLAVDFDRIASSKESLAASALGRADGAGSVPAGRAP